MIVEKAEGSSAFLTITFFLNMNSGKNEKPN